jgi:prepilin-type processing-associated H-X9-DG protein/prepilin-type N-terminal cleavage/methylation domain-containing protein
LSRFSRTFRIRMTSGMGSMTRIKRPRGMTLIEMLVVISIVAIASVLILAAIMSAREATRRAACLNHLRQFGTGLLDYESAHRALPPYSRWSFSTHAVLLPYLEQGTIANGLNFDVSRDESPRELTEETSIEIFRCPSDFIPNREGNTNYGVNVNIWTKNSSFGTDSTPLRDFTDGTSQTVAVSEFVSLSRGPGLGGSYELVNRYEDVEKLAVACDQVSTATAKPFFGLGRYWSEGLAPNTIYSHILPINHHSCSNGASLGLGVWTAGSRHPGGANVLFLDGHARFLADSTSLAIWRGLGTKNGGELIETQ